MSHNFSTWTWLDPNLQLPTLGGQNDTITISGFSGGGSFAADMHTVYSDSIKGAALVSSGPYADLHRTKSDW